MMLKLCNDVIVLVRRAQFQLLSVSTGHVSWQMQYDGTATRVAHLVPAISRYVDGVLIKATSPLADATASRHDLDLWVSAFLCLHIKVAQWPWTECKLLSC